MTTPSLPGRPEKQDGSALVVAAIVLLLLTTMGITLLFVADSDAKMNQAGIRAKKTFYVAEAGLEAGRDQLRVNNAASTNPKSLSDELYVGAGTNHSINFDVANLKPAYDANGNVTGFTGYGDDVPIKASTAFGGGYYAAFLTNDPIDGKANLTDTNYQVMITAIGAGRDQSVEIVQAIVRPYKLPAFPATITLLGPTAALDGGNSNAKVYKGDDCVGAAGYTGIPGLSVPVVGTIGTASEASAETGVQKPGSFTSGGATGTDTVSDVEGSIDPTWLDCNGLHAMADTVRAAADYVCTSSSPCTHWGATSIDTVTFVDGDLTIGPTNTGRGVLWVTGTLTVRGNTSWDGVILVIGTGAFYRNGGGNGTTYGAEVVANIAGPDGVYGNGDDCTGGTGGFGVAIHDNSGGGTHDTVYCSDAISQALNGFPMKIVDFRQR